MEWNLAELYESLARAFPERECIVAGDRRWTWSAFAERTRRLAQVLAADGLGRHQERNRLSPWESGQDHLALYLYNGPEYLEGMLGAFTAGVASFNVNYRYVEEELVHLFADSGAQAVVFHSVFAPTLARILPRLPGLRLLLQVPDDSGHALLPGAIDYEDALSAALPSPLAVERSPDDLYILYTGGTTGLPRAVLWRQADIFVAALSGRGRDGSEFDSFEAVLERAQRGTSRQLPLPPFMHGAAHWGALSTLLAGGTVVLPTETRWLDPDDAWATVERERVTSLLIVGDAFARPLLEQLRRQTYDLTSLRAVVSGGAILSPAFKRELVERLGVRILDAMGSSEAGGQASQDDAFETDPTFQPSPGTCVVDDSRTTVLPPGANETGWLARSGRIPLGYLGDPERTASTFPVIDGVRYAIPGDRAQLLADGSIRLLGRDSTTINSGGEKIYAEEVERAIKRHPAVADVVVTGRPSLRWGQEVVALIQPQAGTAPVAGELVDACRGQLASYKIPKAIVFVDAVVRSPSGKPDYRWAKERAGAEGVSVSPAEVSSPDPSAPGPG
ncbi:MAG: acyl-CoA synthetase [Actinomycetota bacterium]